MRYNWHTINYIYLKDYFDKFRYQDNEFIYYPQSFLTPIGIPPSLPIPWKRKWQPTPALLPGKSHGRRSLVCCSPWGREESDATERLHFLFSLSCTGEGNGTPPQWVLAWRIPGTGEPGGLPSMGSHRVRQDWSDLAAAAAYSQGISPGQNTGVE